MMRIHRLLETVNLEDVEILKVERLLGVRLPSVTDSDFEMNVKLVEDAVVRFGEWLAARRSPPFMKVFELYVNDECKLNGDELLTRIQGWPAKARARASTAS